MRVKIDNGNQPYTFGEFLGLLPPESCDRCGGDYATVIIRADGHGLMLLNVHPSRVSPVSPADEQAYRRLENEKIS